MIELTLDMLKNKDLIRILENNSKKQNIHKDEINTLENHNRDIRLILGDRCKINNDC